MKDRKPSKRNYPDPNKPRHANLCLAPEQYSVPETIKVISYNIRHSKKIDRAITLLKENRQLVQADILCLQEMDPLGVAQIALACKYNYVYYPAIFHSYTKKDFGNAILTKWPILDDRKTILPQIKRQKLQRIAVQSTINVAGKHISLVSLHMKVFLKHNHRSEQIDSVIKSLSPSTDACIIAGDFNTYTRQARKVIIERFRQDGFQLATEDIGWTHKHLSLINKHNYLDHIYIKGFELVKKGKVINKKVSDHLPIWAELKLV